MQIRKYARIVSGTDDSAALDFCLVVGRTPLMVSFFDRSLLTVKAIGAGFNARNSYVRLHGTPYGATTLYPQCGYDFYSAKIEGLDPFYHGIAVSEDIHKKSLITLKGREAEDFYSFLMHNFSLPLMREWSGALWNWASTSVCREECGILYMSNPEEKRIVPLPDGRKVCLQDLSVYDVQITLEQLENAVSSMLRSGIIRITDVPQNDLVFDGMDSYFNTYGKSIVDNLKKQLNPLTDYDGEAHNFTLKHKRLYPQQLAMVNGVVAGLTGRGTKKERRKNRSKYAILNEGMGTGKTLQGASICEAMAVSKAMRCGKSLESIYMDRDSVKYRNIVMCPPHLVEKWVEEVQSEIPYATAHILDTFEDVVELWQRGPERTGKEFYVLSKDFAKLSYSEKPVPTRVTRGKLMYRKCKSCKREVSGLKCSCGSDEWDVLPSKQEVTGLQCPNCSSILVPYKGKGDKKNKDEDDCVGLTLTPVDFSSQRTSNSTCLYCGEPLWQPHVRNIGCTERGKWRKISHYANKAKKRKVTAWVHINHIEDYLLEKDIEPNEYTFVKGEGVRRYDPASFIKKKMKNFFDIAIFDEVHMLKGGDTAQGHAMHALIRSSHQQLALTGTIAGGCAHHLFYVLFRLDPARMRKEGFSWSKVSKFAEVYGSIETEYEAVPSYDGEYNVCSRGKRMHEPKVVPGISPLIYTRFLLDKAVMLDITDMSQHLPKLHENVVLVEAEDPDECEAQSKYAGIVQYLKDLARSGLGMSVLSTMLQFSLSYLDKPYGVGNILDPFTGAELVEVPSFDKFSDVRNLLAKEKELVRIVKSELAENRNCFVYAEYTNSPQTCITQRLKDVLMYHAGLKDNEVVVLDSTAVEASKREAWIHEKAEAGMKVCIVNPRCVETGLDFCFKYKGKVYNYQTILFFQLSYSLFTNWQASRRHYRLNQKDECRTYYMAYKGTVQEVVISLIAEKMAATAAIQGKFSAEGISAMAQGVDTRIRLAQALSNMDEETGKELQSMFDVVNSANNSSEEDSKYQPMLLLRELIGEDNVNAQERTVEEISELPSFDILSLFEEDIFGDDEETVVDVDTSEEVVVNPYPEGCIFNPVNAFKSTLQVNKEEVVLTASMETVTETVSDVDQGLGEEFFSLMDLLFGDTSSEVSSKKSVGVTPKKSKSKKMMDNQELLF